MVLPVTANLFAHYEADTLAFADGATITSWPDLSGNAHHLADTTTTKPTCQTNSLNGLRGVLFTDAQELRNLDNNTGDETLYLVLKNHPNTGAIRYINGLYYPYMVKTATADRFDFGGLLVTEAGIAAAQGIWTWQYRATNSILRWNQVQKVAGNIIPAASDGFELGNSNNAAGSTMTGYEVIRYAGIHSDGDRDLVEDYLFNKWFVVPPDPPDAPANPAAVAVSSSQIDVSWDDVAGETGFRVERSLTGAGGWSDVSGALGVGVTTYSDTGLAASTQYFYRIFAFNGDGDSPASSTVDATTQAASNGGGNQMDGNAIRKPPRLRRRR